MTNKILIDRELLVRVQDVLSRWSEIINYQYCGSMEAMTYLQVTDDMSQPVLNEVNATLNAPQQEAVYAYRRKGLDYFCTCDEERYNELAQKPKLFEVTKFYLHPTPSVPEGWQLVPKEPTPKMIDATWGDQIETSGQPESHNTRNHRVYRAMLRAAPKAPTTDDRKDAERYQWLCNHRNVLLLTGFFGNGCINRTIEEVHAAIDAAMAAQKGEPDGL